MSRYSDHFKKVNGIIPPPKKVNGHHAPEDIARRALAEPIDLDLISAQRMWGPTGKPPEGKPEPPKRQPTQKALMLAKMLMDPNFGRRR